jgi:hypothetical protein
MILLMPEEGTTSLQDSCEARRPAEIMGQARYSQNGNRDIIDPPTLILSRISASCFAQCAPSPVAPLSAIVQERSPERSPGRTPLLLLLWFLLAGSVHAFAQGGPPYYTNDPGTPGNFDWEINLGYMPFLYSDQSVSHTPDVDINFGVGERVQLTYENAWLRVQSPSGAAKFGLGQSNPGVKWRFLDHGESGLNISAFPQFFLNNPNDAVRRGITSASQAFLLPLEFSRKFGPIDVDYEGGYLFVHKGPNGWLNGLVIGHDFTSRLEMDMELYNQGTFHPSANQPSIDFGGRYKIRPSLILLFMAGRSLEAAHNNQTYFLGYFGMQFLLGHKHEPDLPPPAERN